MHVKELLSLKGKIIVVTGGAGLYGKCIVKGLSQADGTVVIASRNLAASQQVATQFQTENLDVHALQLDQADHNSVIAFKNELQEKFGRLDVLVNNAVARTTKGYNTSIESFEESLKVNGVGIFDLTREMADLMDQNSGGVIINIASMMGMFGPDLSNYEGTSMGDIAPDYFFHRAGMINYTRYLARFLASKNIRANCISPGGYYNRQNPQPEAFLKNYCKKVPCGRMANDDDIKGLVVFLASDASAYVNGQNILMDGGMHC